MAVGTSWALPGLTVLRCMYYDRSHIRQIGHTNLDLWSPLPLLSLLLLPLFQFLVLLLDQCDQSITTTLKFLGKQPQVCKYRKQSLH